MLAAALFLLLTLIGGCGVAQTEECQQYLACQAYFDNLFERDPADTNLYQPDGVCWENDDLARECSFACLSKTSDLVERLEAEDEELGDCG